jgi:hypothetical protein
MRHTPLSRSSIPALLVVVGSAGLVSPALAEDKTLLRLRAVTVDLGNPERTNSGTLEIGIERWATEEECEQLRDALINKGSQALLSALQKIKPRGGYLRTSISPDWDILFAREVPSGEGARRIIIATDRPVSFREGMSPRRYEFSLAEIRLTKEGTGVGKLVSAAKISYDNRTRSVEIENYSNEPVRLTDVKVLAQK